jgi:hypothetical protein
MPRRERPTRHRPPCLLLGLVLAAALPGARCFDEMSIELPSGMVVTVTHDVRDDVIVVW